MNMRILVFLVGLFSLVVGWLTYDGEIATAPVPIVTGGIVMILALTGLLPEFKFCQSCNKKIRKKSSVCPFCKTNQ